MYSIPHGCRRFEATTPFTRRACRSRHGFQLISFTGEAMEDDTKGITSSYDAPDMQSAAVVLPSSPC